MPNTFAPEIAMTDSVPSGKANGGVVGGRMRRFRATIEYKGQASGDTITLAKVPPGMTFAFGVLTATATAGTTTIAIGKAGAVAKYRAAATFTAADTPTFFGLAAAAGSVPSTEEEMVIATLAVASLPTSANYLVVDLYFSAP